MQKQDQESLTKASQGTLARRINEAVQEIKDETDGSPERDREITGARTVADYIAGELSAKDGLALIMKSSGILWRLIGCLSHCISNRINSLYSITGGYK